MTSPTLPTRTVAETRAAVQMRERAAKALESMSFPHSSTAEAVARIRDLPLFEGEKT